METDITDEKSPNRSRYSNTCLHQLACRNKQSNFRETTPSDFWQKLYFFKTGYDVGTYALSLVNTAAVAVVGLIYNWKQILRFASGLLAFIIIGRHQRALFSLCNISRVTQRDVWRPDLESLDCTCKSSHAESSVGCTISNDIGILCYFMQNTFVDRKGKAK